VRVGRVLDRVVQRADHGDHLLGTQTGQRPVAQRARRQVQHVRLALAGYQRQLTQAQLPGRIPGVEHLPVGGDGGQADAPGGICGRHCYTSRSRPGRPRLAPRTDRPEGTVRTMENPLTPEVLADPVQLTRVLVDIESVSLNEKAIADFVEEVLRGVPHLSTHRHGNTVMARTDLGRSQRVVLAGHLDTVPLNNNFPSTMRGDLMYGCGTSDM